MYNFFVKTEKKSNVFLQVKLIQEQSVLESFFDSLPREVKLSIFEYLPARDLAKISRVSKGWKVLISEDALWENKLKNDLPITSKFEFDAIKTQYNSAKEAYYQYKPCINLFRIMKALQNNYLISLDVSNTLIPDVKTFIQNTSKPKPKKQIEFKALSEVDKQRVDREVPYEYEYKGEIKKRHVPFLMLPLAGQQLAISRSINDVEIWDINLKKHLCTLKGKGKNNEKNYPGDGNISALADLGDGRLATGSTNGIIKFWEIKSGNYLTTIYVGQPINALTLLANGELVAACGDYFFSERKFISYLKFFDSKTGKELNSVNLKILPKCITEFSEFQNTHCLALGTFMGQLYYYNLHTHTVMEQPPTNAHLQPVSGIIDLLDERFISWDGEVVKLWDKKTLECLQVYERSQFRGAIKRALQEPVDPASIALLPNYRQFISGEMHGKAILWDINSGKCLGNFYAQNNLINNLIRGVAFLPSGELVNSSYTPRSTTIKLWRFPVCRLSCQDFLPLLSVIEKNISLKVLDLGNMQFDEQFMHALIQLIKNRRDAKLELHIDNQALSLNSAKELLSAIDENPSITVHWKQAVSTEIQPTEGTTLHL